MNTIQHRLPFVLLILSILFGLVHPANAAIPSYAKWGQLAVKTAKEKYPSANIIDYLHIGREEKDKTSIEKFKLWVDNSGTEFGLYISIEFDPKNDRVIQIHTRKSDN
ncbi:hypothetical protein J2Z40_000286 [Cytobacillus eiseniae]|uniref:DUF3889 domain-containing protein n=1 Tax=Cytobacillus eiseniae TaxID=762947 RepID=A0ABS4RA05_9BACI|nr:DUF3889 domain-containing protein [Cytobacillus eiseniae]MBP2239733.1 hypothetical protein [Cytobacillus eiseniae]